MKMTRIMWDMPVTVRIADSGDSRPDIEDLYRYFAHVDRVFSTFKPESEVSRINRGEIPESLWSPEVTEVMRLCDRTQEETHGYFSGRRHGMLEPLGLVKGWALHNAEIMLKKKGYRNFYIEAGGDMAVAGYNEEGALWRVGIRNPFDRSQIVKVISVTDCGIATSGTYIRGDHIYNPVDPKRKNDIVSTTVVAPSVYEADRFATAAFAMGRDGINFILGKQGLEGYQINSKGIATYTAGFPADAKTYDHHELDRLIA